MVVGSAPYGDGVHRARCERPGEDDPRVRLLGGVYDQELLDELYLHAQRYVHGHAVGGTNPSLLRAMGAGTAVLAWDVAFNREVAADRARYFGDPGGQLAALIDATEHDPDRGIARRGGAARRRPDQVPVGRRGRRLRGAGDVS